MEVHFFAVRSPVHQDAAVHRPEPLRFVPAWYVMLTPVPKAPATFGTAKATTVA